MPSPHTLDGLHGQPYSAWRLCWFQIMRGGLARSLKCPHGVWMINSAAWAIPNVVLLSAKKDKYIGCEWWPARESWNVCSASVFCELNSFPKPLFSPLQMFRRKMQMRIFLMLQNCQMLCKKANRMPSHPGGPSLMGNVHCHQSPCQRVHDKRYSFIS